MRNLQLLHSVRVADASELSRPQCISIDYDLGTVYVATASCIAALNPKTQEVVQQVSLVEDGYLPADGSGIVVGIQHLPDQMSVCVALTSGDLLLWNTTMAQLECVGSVESGITSMSWSPDHEILVLTTGQNTIISMTREFDPITETAMQPSEFGEAQFITVGWGKKETQFHGSEGKQAAAKKHEEVKAVFSWDDSQPRISWRADGQYFVVSSVSVQTGARQLRVWTRECVLHSTSENVNGIEQCLAWKPSGSLIVSSQRRPNKHDIAFFEINGLRHGEFTLPFDVKEVNVMEVMWNTESTVLAVWCQQLPPEDTDITNFVPKSYVQLWTVNNYHWYLKQQLSFPASSEDRVASVTWDPEHAYRLHIVCQGGQYLQYTWSWATCHSRGQTVDDLTQVAVIDADKVLLTPLRNMIVPPPMSAYHLQLPTPVNQVLFAPPPYSNDIAVLMDDGQIAIFTMNGQDNGVKTVGAVVVGAAGTPGFKVKCATPTLHSTMSVEGELVDGEFPLKLYHLCWSHEDTMLATTLDMMGSQSVLLQLHLDKHTKTLTLKHSLDVGHYVFGMSVSSDSGRVLLQMTDGALYTYSTEECRLQQFESRDGRYVRFPLPCTQMALTNLAGEEVAVGLTDRFRLYVNDLEIANNCTSFAIHDEFILLSTHAHTCRCISRSTPIKVLPTLTGDKSHPFDESVRRVERGSRIVCVVPEDTKLILQMPRGNLETVHPRALILSAVRKCLDRLEYNLAFMLMKKHRINMNLLYDHNPAAFISNVAAFIQQINLVNHINLFLTDLQEEDVTLTMYTTAYSPDRVKATQSAAGRSKVDTVCDTLREALQANNENKYLLSILTAYVKKSTPELDTALQRIKQLRDCGDNSMDAEEALKFLLFLVDVNELYDVALGTYDFDLVIMVAEKSQKDPKEYLPFLNNLRRMETNYQRYNIDKHLKRYTKALHHISKCGAEHFSECVSLVKDHRLYSEALKLFPVDSQQYQDVAVSFGDYLSERRYHEEAGVMYSKAGEWQMAHDAYVESLNWQQAMVTASRLGHSPEQQAQLARSLAGKLAEVRRHGDAAIVLREYAEDIEEAIVMLIDGSLWDEAIRLMYQHNRTDFIETNLKPALQEVVTSQIANLDTTRGQFEKYKARLSVVRDEKEKARIEFLEGGGAYNDADADLFSDTSSATGESVRSESTRSKYSTTSSQRSSVYSKVSGSSRKSKRKAERRKWSLKEGSRNEDLALIEAMSKIITEVETTKTIELSSLLKTLVLFHYDEQAEELQNKMADLETLIDKSVPDIWDPDQNNPTATPILGPESTANQIAQAMQQGQTPSTGEKLDPIIAVPPTVNKQLKWQLRLLKKPDSSTS